MEIKDLRLMVWGLRARYLGPENLEATAETISFFQLNNSLFSATAIYTLKKVVNFPVPSRDVTNQRWVG
jgi:hypothetical protein